MDLFTPYEPPTDTDGHPLPVPDITRRKHGGNEQSEAAFQRVEPHIPAMQAHALEWWRLNGPATSKEYSAATGFPLHAVSARLSELKRDGKMIETGERRGHAAVVRLA